MHSIRSITLAFALLGAAAASTVALATENQDHAAPASAAGELVRATSKDAAWVAQQKATYPTDVCIVSGDKLAESDMGKPVDVVAGNRLIRFCCNACPADFAKEPLKFIKMLDAK